MTKWVNHLNKTVLLNHGTTLVGGFPEPYYKAPGTATLAEVQFTHDYERSALHELGHWCIAGKQRRLVNDYDYWYIPDGRTDIQQDQFFDVEVKPQALEKFFCMALDIPFDVSIDNPGNHSETGVDAFSKRIVEQYATYQAEGFPSRATEVCNCLRQWHARHSTQDRS